MKHENKTWRKNPVLNVPSVGSHSTAVSENENSWCKQLFSPINTTFCVGAQIYNEIKPKKLVQIYFVCSLFLI